MSEQCTVHINGQALQVGLGVSVMAALSLQGPGITRLSVSGEARSAFCGMGICQECVVTINGMRQLACQTLVHAGMVVCTATQENS